MSNWQRKLVVGALLLIAVGILLGFADATIVRYGTMPVLQYRAHRMAAELAARGAPEETIRAAAFESYTNTRLVDAHTHIIKVATVLLLIAFIYPQISLPEKPKRVLAVMFLTGNCAFPLGVLAEIYVQGRPAQALAAIGAVLIVTSFAGMLWGLIRCTAGPIRRSPEI